jgi:putative endonuclease
MVTNKVHTVLYTGVTGDIARRAYEHKTHAVPGFTARYNVEKLVYAEETNDISGAIDREKAIKRMSRAAKERLINKVNPNWEELETF